MRGVEPPLAHQGDRDFALLQASVFITGLTIILLNILIDMTYALVDTAHYVRPTPSLGLDTTLIFGGTSVQVLYPGGGHTRDNIVVWLPASRILFGGCLVKADSAESLGYIADADLASWPGAITMLLHRFPRARIVVPGHGAVGGRGLLKHTLALLRERGE